MTPQQLLELKDQIKNDEAELERQQGVLEQLMSTLLEEYKLRGVKEANGEVIKIKSDIAALTEELNNKLDEIERTMNKDE